MKPLFVTLSFALSLVFAAATEPSAQPPPSPAPAVPNPVSGSEPAAVTPPASEAPSKAETAPKTKTPPKAETPPKPKISYSEFHVPGNVIALTFDDGPHIKNTPRLLDMLKERGIKVTFFLIGKNAAAYPDIVKRIVAEGHEVGNHTWTHPQLSRLSHAAIASELQRTRNAITAACGVEPKLYRPPYGSVTLSQKKWIWETFHYPTILWEVDTEDWKSPRLASKVHDTILRETHNGSMILCHDIHVTTIDAMPSTLDDLQAKGFTFLTVSQMIALEAETQRKPPVAEIVGPETSTKPGATPAPATTGPVPPPPAAPASGGETILPALPAAQGTPHP